MGSVENVENVECGKMWSVETGECENWGVWKLWSVEIEECGRMRSGQ